MKTTKQLMLFALLTICSTPSFAKIDCAQLSEKTLNDALQQAAKTSTAIASKDFSQQQLTGLGIAISVCGKTVWQHYQGYANLETKHPVNSTTKFRAASISKTFTSVAMAHLQQHGKLNYDDIIMPFVPEYQFTQYPITFRQLAAHTAGIRGYKGQEFYINLHYQTPADGLSIFINDPPLHQADSKYLYSSHGWNLLSVALARAAKQPYLSLMRNAVFDKALMTNTVPDNVFEIIPERASSYQVAKDGSIRNARFVDNSYKWAGGGFLSTPDDLLKFGQVMLNNELVSQSSFDSLTQSHRLLSGKATDYGMGWSRNLPQLSSKLINQWYGQTQGQKISQQLAKHVVLGHSGGAIGGKAYFWVIPELEMVVGAFSNSNISPVMAFSASAEFIKALQ